MFAIAYSTGSRASMGISKKQIAAIFIFLPICCSSFVHSVVSFERSCRHHHRSHSFDRCVRAFNAQNDDDFPANDPVPSRRSFLQRTVFLSVISGCGTTQSVGAVESVEPLPSTVAASVLPYATSVQALIPAVRVRKMMDQSVTLTQQWLALNDDEASPQRSEIVQQLQALSLQKQNFTSSVTIGSLQHNVSVGIRPSRATTKPALPSPSYVDLYNQKRQDLSFWEKPGAFFVQGGEIGTWKALKRNEYRKEETDEIRAALNLYTSNLVYTSTQYTLRVSKEERSQMIREDRLPDLLTQVVPSDMDLRDLYRNALLTAVQEARAELRYQINESNKETTDLTDLLHLLREGQEALNQWFAFIDTKEIAAAELADAESMRLSN